MRMLSKGRTKVAVLTTKPADPAAPTVTELKAGIEASCKIPSSLWRWSAGDPTTETDSPLCVESDNEVPVADTYDTGFGVYREFAEGGASDPLEDALFEATKVRGTTLWIYARKTGKLSLADWAADDEIYLGGEVLTGTPKDVEGGYIKYDVPIFAQRMHNFIKVAAGA